MQNKNKLSQIMMIAGSAIFLTASGVLASLSIETNMENAVQTIRKVIVTDDGTASGEIIAIFDGDPAVSEDMQIQIFGKMRVGNTGNIISPISTWSTIAGGKDNYISGDSSTVAGGRYNAITGGASTIVGGNHNEIIGDQNIVGGGTENKVIGNAMRSSIAGGTNNTITNGSQNSSIAGGENNTIDNSNHAFIAGGAFNTINTADFSFVGGRFAQSSYNGTFVRSDTSDLFNSFESTAPNQFLIRADGGLGVGTNAPGAAIQVVGSAIFGDIGNTAAGTNSFVAGGAGGSLNHANGTASSIGGGVNNSAEGDYSSVGGGSQNSVPSNFSTIGGGQNNTAGFLYSNIGGGYYNTAGGYASTIGGGQSNTSSGSYSTVAGGYINHAPGNRGATIPGGFYNNAEGETSFAAGFKAKALHDGTFVRADRENYDFESTNSGQFLIKAHNGVGINTNDPQYGALQIKGAGNAGGLTLYRGAGTSTRMYINSDNDFHLVRGSSDLAGITIAPDGDVGIGDTSPDPGLMLDVNGGIGATQYCDSNGTNCMDGKNYVDNHRLKNTSYNTESAITDLCHGTETKSSVGSNFDVCFLSYSHVEEGGICRVRQTSSKERKVEAICNGANHYAKCGMYCMNTGQ